MRDRQTGSAYDAGMVLDLLRNGPGSAAHHFVLRRARDTGSIQLK
jgi:hypothetical protein